MFPKIIFFTAVTAATLVVILLALVSPSNRKKNHPLSISLYVQPLQPPKSDQHQQPTLHSSKAFIFNHKLTEGPNNTSRIIGRAQGLVLPIENFALAAFNIIYLTFDTPDYCGSLGVEARTGRRRGDKEELVVVGGTGSFAFARGVAVFVQSRGQQSDDIDAKYHIKLKLSLPQ